MKLNKLKNLIYYQFNNWLIYIWRSGVLSSNVHVTIPQILEM